MEYIGGGALINQIYKRGKFTEQESCIIAKQLLSCASYCHANNVVHRDLKPDNVMLEASKELDQIRVIDFGTA